MATGGGGVVLALLAAIAFPATLILEQLLLQGGGGPMLSNFTPLLGWVIVCAVGILNGQSMSPTAGANAPVIVSYCLFIGLMTIAMYCMPRSACLFYMVWVFFHVTLHPRGRVMRMFRRRGLWIQPLVAMFKFVTVTIIPAITATMGLGLCVRLLTRDVTTCSWFPGMRLFARDKQGTCPSLMVLIPVVIVTVAAAAWSVRLHLRATSIMRLLSGCTGDADVDANSETHMHGLDTLISEAFDREIATVNPSVALRDQTALASDTAFADDRAVLIQAALYEERARQSGMSLKAANIAQKGLSEYGGATRRFSFNDTLQRLTKNGGGRGAEPYHWLKMKRAMTNMRFILALSPPRMPFTFEDVYEAEYNIKRWKMSKADKKPKKKKKTKKTKEEKDDNEGASANANGNGPCSSFLGSYLFPGGYVEWTELNAVALETMRGITDDDVTARKTKDTLPSSDLSKSTYGDEYAKPVGSDAVHLLFFITSLIVPREWTVDADDTDTRASNRVSEVWGATPGN